MEGSGFHPGRIGFLIAVMGSMSDRRVDNLGRGVILLIVVLNRYIDFWS